MVNSPSDSVAASDTVSGSVVHLLFGYLDRAGLGGAFTLLKLYGTVVGLTFLPLFIAALLGKPPHATLAGSPQLTFFHDWNVLFMFLVSFPSLIVLTATDQRVLARALRIAKVEGTIAVSEADWSRMSDRWRGHFRTVNLSGQALGVVVGLAVAYFNYDAYSPPHVGFWIAESGRLLPIGFVFLYCIFLFYALIPVYALRSIAIALLLRNVVAHAEIHMLPLHPDKSGGLRPVGRLGLRNQYVLTLFGLNMVLLWAVSILYLEIPPALYGLMIAAVIAFLVLGPIIFVAPLLPFRSAMLRNKEQLMGEVAQRLRVELGRLRSQLQSGPISDEDENLIERLRKIGAVIDELPVWPFDAGTLRKFLLAYVVPIITGAAYPVARVILKAANIDLPSWLPPDIF